MTSAVLTSESQAIMARARDLFPGGVNSPVRAFGGVGGEPFVVQRGEGPYIWDVDGNRYIDYVLSWGPLVLGHAAPVVLDALHDVMQRGTSFGIPTGLEVQLAELIVERMETGNASRLAVIMTDENDLAALAADKVPSRRPPRSLRTSS